MGPEKGDWDVHTGPDRGTHVCAQLCKGDGTNVNSQTDMYTCTDACTHSMQCVGPEKGVTRLCTPDHTEVHMFVHSYADGFKQMWGVKWTCIHVLMQYAF